MANGRAERVEEALLSLVDAHLTASPGEDEDILEDRRDEAAERAREILETTYGSKVARGIGLGRRWLTVNSAQERSIPRHGCPILTPPFETPHTAGSVTQSRNLGTL
jgi:hypothetical protein